MGVSNLGSGARSTKTGSFATASTTYVTALSLTGSGKLSQLYVDMPTYSMYVRVTIDGGTPIVLNQTNTAGILSIVPVGGPFLSPLTYDAETDISFNKSLLIEGYTTNAGASLQFGWVYEQ